MEVGQFGSQRRSMLAQINVTPFVDVMLVLLIIFMVTAPMLEKGVDVGLPKVANAPNISVSKEPIIVTVTREGKIKVAGQVVNSLSGLEPVLRQILAGRQDQTVNLEADRTVPYGQVAQVMVEISRAGVTKLAVLTEDYDEK